MTRLLLLTTAEKRFIAERQQEGQTVEQLAEYLRVPPAWINDALRNPPPPPPKPGDGRPIKPKPPQDDRPRKARAKKPHEDKPEPPVATLPPVAAVLGYEVAPT